MRIDRLDSYLTTFTASITGVVRDAAGTWLTLDRSAFYPTSGGQLHDTGTLGGSSVTDVKVVDGVVWHLVADAVTDGAEADLAPGSDTSADQAGGVRVGSEVVGVIDWERRFRHMQRHTGQHLLSQAFVRVGAALGAEFGTRSVSLRGPDCTLDLTGDPDEDACAAAAVEADTAARRALPVTAFEVDERHLPEYRLRRPPKVGGSVRLVAIGDYDLVACGGTHVASSAELLPLVVLGSERVRGDLTRVTFRVGSEAVEDAAGKQAVIARLGVELSAQPGELPAQVARLQADLATARGELASARSLAAEHLVAAAGANATEVAGARLVRVTVRGEEAALFDALVDRCQSLGGSVALCAADLGSSVRVALTAGPDTDVDVRPALRAALERIEGRGGGRPDRGMGAGPGVAELEAALDAAAAVLGGPPATG